MSAVIEAVKCNICNLYGRDITIPNGEETECETEDKTILVCKDCVSHAREQVIDEREIQHRIMNYLADEFEALEDRRKDREEGK